MFALPAPTPGRARSKLSRAALLLKGGAVVPSGCGVKLVALVRAVLRKGSRSIRSARDLSSRGILILRGLELPRSLLAIETR